MSFKDKHCVPCEGGVPPIGDDEARALLAQVPGWRLEKGRLCRLFRYRDFAEAMRFVNRMAEIAESEGHHPDFSVSWNAVDVSLSTHAIGGLSENDFILAAKIDQLPIDLK
jgi:4a-hydroxytetrahydrobiopterin dehydratase